MEERVLFYSEHDQLSNFYARPFIWQEQEWQSAEHAYQAAKFFETDPAVVEMIRVAPTSAEAKSVSKKYASHREPNWSTKKLAIMESILRAKLAQDEAFQEMLFMTGTSELIEDSPEDSFWGRGPNGQGENWLGKLWMKLRAERRDQ